MALSSADVEAIERATLSAVSPDRVEGLDGWLLPMDAGPIARAHSAVPLHHGVHDPVLIDVIARAYQRAGLRAVFRLPEVPGFASWWPCLGDRGYRREQPTLTQIGTLDGLLALAAHSEGVALESQPDHAWLAMYLGDGLKAADGAARARALARAQGSVYASLRHGGQTLACCAAGFAHDWLSVHGLRTDARRRRQGLAARLLRGVAQEAQRRGTSRVFLQVDAGNAPALALYHKAGMVTAWRYAYWRPQPR